MSDAIQTKLCTKCNSIKEFSEFFIDKRHRDGMTSACKSCERARLTSYAKTARGKQARKMWDKTENGRRCQQKRDRVKGCLYPEHIKARHAVNNAIRAGAIPRPDTIPCTYCPKQAEHYHHHQSYTEEHWLDVIPLCAACHFKKHIVVSSGH